MKKLILLIGMVLAAYLGIHQSPTSVQRDAGPAAAGGAEQSTLAQALATHAHGAEVTGSGIVVKVLRDDREGSQHQKFLLRVESGETLLVAHNIDLAPRVDALHEGDSVSFKGEYLWNPKGGVIHWTHRDPNGRHAMGWLKHNGQTFQ